MGLTKSEIFTKEQNEIAQLAKALGHPARIAILQQLVKLDCCICGDFTNEIGLAQPTISRHLKELKSVGIIAGTVSGTKMNYCINPIKWREVQTLLNLLFDAFDKPDLSCATDNCGC